MYIINIYSCNLRQWKSRGAFLFRACFIPITLNLKIYKYALNRNMNGFLYVRPIDVRSTISLINHYEILRFIYVKMKCKFRLIT